MLLICSCGRMLTLGVAGRIVIFGHSSSDSSDSRWWYFLLL